MGEVYPPDLGEQKVTSHSTVENVYLKTMISKNKIRDEESVGPGEL